MTLTSGQLRQSLLGREDIMGRSAAIMIVKNLDTKGISYVLNCEDVVYHKKEVTQALQSI